MINTAHPTSPPAPTPVATQAATLDSRALFHGTREVVISHAGEQYRLQLTRNNRLILIK